MSTVRPYRGRFARSRAHRTRAAFQALAMPPLYASAPPWGRTVPQRHPASVHDFYPNPDHPELLRGDYGVYGAAQKEILSGLRFWSLNRVIFKVSRRTIFTTLLSHRDKQVGAV